MMKKSTLYTALLVIIIGFSIVTIVKKKMQKDAWTQDQLLEPSALASVLNDPTATAPLIFSMGPSGPIKGAVVIGAAEEQSNLDQLKAQLNNVPKDKEVVVYCGCCPFENCPNVRPAMKLLNDLGYTHAKLLNLSTNLKADWIDKGYPMN